MGRNLYVDLLRGYSIVAVFAVHGGIAPAFWSFMGNHLRSNFMQNGYYGVCIFFVISGYLITATALRRWWTLGNIDLREFYILRAARILPLLLLFSAAMAMLWALRIDGFVPKTPELFFGAIWSALTFQFNTYYQVSNVPGTVGLSQLWSLSIEEMFYIFFPLACVLLRQTRMAIIVVLITLIAHAPAARLTTGFYTWFSCADMLAMGCLTAILVANLPRSAIGTSAAGASLVAGVVIIWGIFGWGSVHENSMFGPTIVAFGAALVLFGATYLPQVPSEGSWRRLRIVLWPQASFGRLSYELYLFHIPALILFRQFVGSPSEKPFLDVIFLAGLWAFAWIINRYVTENVNQRIRRGFLAPAELQALAA